MQNKIKLAVLAGCAALGLSFGSLAQANDPYAHVSSVGLCVGCSTTAQFNAAGRSLIPSTYNGTMTYLIVNPDNGDARWVEVTNTPRGQVPLRVGELQKQSAQPTQLRSGQPVSMGPDTSALIFAADLDMTSSSGNYQTSYPLDGQASQEVVASVKMSKDVLYYKLPVNSSYFASFSQRQQEAVALANNGAATDAYPGWAVNSIGKRVRNALMARLKLAGQTVTVCAIYNNGDIGCSNPDPTNPSLENHVAGSAKNAQGAQIGGWGGGGGGDFSPGVNAGLRAPDYGYSRPGNTGRTGELWMFCGSIGGVVQSCYFVIL